MASPSTPISEEHRLRAVYATGLLDSPPEAEYDQLVGLAAEICGTPISTLTLVDRERQWFKAAVGVQDHEAARGVSFCAHAILGEELFEVEDACADPRFAGNPLVTDAPGIRFYAGMPLEGPGGQMLGTLCVIDRVPRRLRTSQREALRVLAAQVRTRIELRIQERQLEDALRATEVILAELRTSEAELRASEDRFRTFIDHAPFLSYIKDGAGRMLFYNRRLAEQFGISRTEWIGKDDFEIWPRDLAARFRALDREVMRGGSPIERTEVTPDDRGGLMEWKSYKFPWTDNSGEQLLGGFSVDTTAERSGREALEEVNRQLERQATTDPLTGLSNRRALDERVECEFQGARRHGTALGVVLLDVDDFKRRNDRFGHASGDAVLRQMGALIASQLRPTDLAARYGGEEFVLLLPGADAEGAELFALRLRSAIARAEWPDAPLTASFGTAAVDATTRSGGRLIALADDAMYEAKRRGKDCVVTHAQLIARALAELSGLSVPAALLESSTADSRGRVAA